MNSKHAGLEEIKVKMLENYNKENLIPVFDVVWSVGLAPNCQYKCHFVVVVDKRVL